MSWVVLSPTVIREILQREGVKLSRQAQRSRQHLIAEAKQLAPYIQEALSQAALLHSADYLGNPTHEQRKRAIQRFISATNNEALHSVVCGVCARESHAASCETYPIAEIPHRHHLRPDSTQLGMILIDGLLLAEAALSEPDGQGKVVTVCERCLCDLKANKKPQYALTNGLWLGDSPSVLMNLTIPEQMLIALVYPRCFVFKMHPLTRGGHDPTTLQRGMRGNVTSYNMDMTEIVDMVEGRKMPRPTRILASIIAVTYVGRGQLPTQWLKSTFRVRRRNVLQALQWLIEHNPFYREVQIDESMLASLPDDDIPIEIRAGMRQEPDEVVLDEENNAYMTPEDDSDGADSAMELDRTDPSVVPLNHLGMAAQDVSLLSSGDLLLHALANLSDEGGYAIRPPPSYARDLGHDQFRYFACAFPHLFPYGSGAPKGDQSQPLTYLDHIQWCLQYYDRRFRKDHSFPFVAFGLYQKQLSLQSARLQMSRREFEADMDSLSQIKLSELRTAAQEEAQKKPISSPKVRALMKHVKTTASQVVGTNQSRASIRSKIWSQTIKHGPPSLWVTINPSDLHDPVAQVFCGEDIDLDSFERVVGPNATERSQNLAADPYAAARFFHLIINTMLQTLVGVEKRTHSVSITGGVLGQVVAYIGVVESQNRATLHLHLLLWLAHTPSPDQIKEALKTPEFQAKVTAYLSRHIRAHFPGISATTVSAMPREADLAWSRPLDLAQDGCEEARLDMERRLVRSNQIHSCRVGACLNLDRRTGLMTCKRRAPWPLSEEDTVDEYGNWKIRRTYGYVNGYHPDLLVTLRCNQDIKLLTNGQDTKHLSWYISNYATKGQKSLYNLSSLVAKYAAYQFKEDEQILDSRERTRNLLFRCLRAANWEAEQSGPQVISYLMGWGDRFMSHHFAPLYWNGVRGQLLRWFPELYQTSASTRRKLGDQVRSSRDDGSTEEMDENALVPDKDETDKDGVDEVGLKVMRDGKLGFRTQIMDYIYRGHELEDCCLYDFIGNTYEERVARKPSKPVEPKVTTTGKTRGRRKSQRSRYLDDHPFHSSQQRVVRTDGHNTIVDIVGQWPARRSAEGDNGLYYATLLALWKPWRSKDDFKGKEETWHNAYLRLEAGNPEVAYVASNLQYRYDCKDAADKDNCNRISGITGTEGSPARESESEEEETEVRTAQGSGTEADLLRFIAQRSQTEEILHGRKAIEIAKGAHILPDIAHAWEVREQPIHAATGEDLGRFVRWSQTLMGKRNEEGVTHGTATVTSMEELLSLTQGACEAAMTHTVEYLDHSQAFPDTVDVSSFHPDQLRAYGIITHHFAAKQRGEAPAQLQMILTGEGGTGKSRVIHSVVEYFKQHNAVTKIALGAYTGIAASLIGGKTLHVLFGLSARGAKMPSAKKIEELARFWWGKEYLIIDEYSMVSRTLFARMSSILELVQRHNSPGEGGTKPWGGLNVIICGDFHQFKPVGQNRGAPLYWKSAKDKHTAEEAAGSELYARFTTVVCLTQQMRVQDEIWTEFLRYCRHGKCEERHMKMLRELLVQRGSARRMGAMGEGWADAILVTSRHAVRTQWNELALRSHCERTGNTLYRFRAEDRIGGRELTLEERWALARHVFKDNQYSARLKRQGGLQAMVELAIGCKIIITTNMDTDMDIANGARGQVVAMWADPREAVGVGGAIQEMKYPPSCILVKLDRYRGGVIENLGANTIPIFPVVRTFDLFTGKGKKKVVRRQITMDAAYAFTDYRAQGQTIEHLWADIGTPPRGALTPFNAYVTLSRARGRNNIRLIRDFKDTLFTTTPCEVLEEEDKHLEEANRRTKAEWERKLVEGS